MEAWGKWFEQIAERTVENGGFRGAREISESGTKELPWGEARAPRSSLGLQTSTESAQSIRGGSIRR